MTRQTIVALLATFTAAAPLVAGTIQSIENDQPMNTMSQEAMPRAETYTGCLRMGTTPGAFVLTNADAPMNGAMRNTQGEDAAMDHDRMPATLTLRGTPGELRVHVGHKVTVTGARAAKMAEQTETAAAFTVKTLKLVATTCP